MPPAHQDSAGAPPAAASAPADTVPPDRFMPLADAVLPDRFMPQIRDLGVGFAFPRINLDGLVPPAAPLATARREPDAAAAREFPAASLTVEEACKVLRATQMEAARADSGLRRRRLDVLLVRGLLLLLDGGRSGAVVLVVRVRAAMAGARMRRQDEWEATSLRRPLAVAGATRRRRPQPPRPRCRAASLFSSRVPRCRGGRSRLLSALPSPSPSPRERHEHGPASSSEQQPQARMSNGSGAR